MQLSGHLSQSTCTRGSLPWQNAASHRTLLQEGIAFLSCAPQRATHRQKHVNVVATASHHDDCAHVFGEKGHIAGIPTCSKCTAVGARLRYTLRNRPHDFVSLALQEVQEIIARPDSQPVACFLTAQEVRRRQDMTQPQPQASHYASVRARLEASLVRSALRSPPLEQEQPVRGILPGDAKFLELVDVMYYWALGEAYLQHPQLQADMRQSLRRPGEGPLAAGDDNLELRSRVQLLDGPFYEGSYLIGSVNFVRSANSTDEDMEGPRSSGIQWGGSPDPGERLPVPSLEGVWNSNASHMLMALEGDNPARMMRQGAARTYHMYQASIVGRCIEQSGFITELWGYFQRRMTARRLGDAETSRQQAETNPDASPEALEEPPGCSGSAGYGTPWRFFENVPGHLSKMRTNEAASVAMRHRQALFGDGTECITTLQAWQQMTHEAKWFGRALYDAEEFILGSCLPTLQESSETRI